MWAISKGNVIFQPSFFRGYLSYWSGGVCTFSFPEKKGGAVFWFSWNILPVLKMGWNIGRETLKLRFHSRNVHWLISRPHQEWKELMWVVWVVTDIGTLRALTRKDNRKAPLALLAPLALCRKIIWNAPLAPLAPLALVGKLFEMRHLPHLPHLPLLLLLYY